MSKYRETPCKYYQSYGSCAKGRAAKHKGYCKHCDKYCPRARVRHLNRKKQYNERQRKNDAAWARKEYV